MNEYPDDDSMPTMRGAAPASGRRLRAGDVLLARYTVLSELGEGGMGVVYKCLDQVGGIEVAVKCLPPDLSRNEGEMEGIRENYGIVAKLHHSAISGLRQLERDPATGEYYLVMDLAEGEALSAILRRRRGRPMPLEEALAILRPLAAALDYAHGERVLHRDVKPANVKVLVTGGSDHATTGPCDPATIGPSDHATMRPSDHATMRPSDHATMRPSDHATALRVQLLDFGLAAEVRSSMSRVSVRGHGGASGTPAYMAPEQWEARRPDFRTDQYALAVMAYQMLAGFLPFDSEDTDLLRRAVLSRAPDPVEGLPSAANAALLRALAKDPAARFPSCTAFVAALASGKDMSGMRPPWHAGWLVAALLAVAGLGALLLSPSHGGGEGISHAKPEASAPVFEPVPEPAAPAPELAPVPTTTTMTRHVVPSSLPTTTTVTHPLRSSPSSGPRLSAEEMSRLLSAGAEISDHTSIPSSEMSRCFAIINHAIRKAWIRPDAASITGNNPEISISIGSGGVVRSVSLSKSSGNAVFDQSVLSAARAVRKFEGLSEEFIRAKSTFTVEFYLLKVD